MRTQAQAMFYPEMLLLEASRGPINWIYADSKKLPTTGIGNLLGSTSALGRDALEMPWRFANRDRLHLCWWPRPQPGQRVSHHWRRHVQRGTALYAVGLHVDQLQANSRFQKPDH